MTRKHYPPWRVGRKVGRTIYDANNHLIGVMDTPTLAAIVVEAVNVWALLPQRHLTGKGKGNGPTDTV